jgi:hypothetical protein
LLGRETSLLPKKLPSESLFAAVEGAATAEAGAAAGGAEEATVFAGRGWAGAVVTPGTAGRLFAAIGASFAAEDEAAEVGAVSGGGEGVSSRTSGADLTTVRLILRTFFPSARMMISPTSSVTRSPATVALPDLRSCPTLAAESADEAKNPDNDLEPPKEDDEGADCFAVSDAGDAASAAEAELIPDEE